MPIKERTLLLQINEQVKKLTQPQVSTFAPQTGEVEEKPAPTTSTTPRPLPPLTQFQR